MGRRFARLALVGAVVIAGWSTPSPARAAGWAQGLFDEKGHDFGPVPRGAKVRHAFAVTNRLAEPVTILDVHASCGCTTGRATAKTLAPGQAAAVEAEMDTRNFVGKKATTLTVGLMTAAGKEGEARLHVSSEILSDIVLNPGTLDFGAVSRGSSPAASLTIDRVGNPSWRAERLLLMGRGVPLIGQLTPLPRPGSTLAYRLDVTLKADAPAGPFRDEIRIVTNDPEAPSIPVPVIGTILGDVAAAPSLLALGQADPATPASGRYVLKGARPFAIAAIEGNGDGFTLAPADPSGRAKSLHVLSLTVAPGPGTPRGDLRRAFRVRTDLPGEPPVDLAATVRVAP